MKGAACATVAAARRCCFRASASSSRAGGARTRLPGSVRSGDRRAAVTPVFVCTGSPTVCACPVTPLFRSRDLQALRPRVGAAPRRGTGSLAAPRRCRQWGCFWPCARLAAVSSLSVIEDLLEGTNETSSGRVHPPSAGATGRGQSLQLLVRRRALRYRGEPCGLLRLSITPLRAAAQIVLLLPRSQPVSWAVPLGEQPVQRAGRGPVRCARPQSSVNKIAGK